MDINDTGNFQRFWFVTFGVQRLNGMADALSKWMAHGAQVAGNGRRIEFAECEAAARGYFAQRPQQEALAGRHLQALAAARRLTDHHASFLAQPARGDIGALLADAGAALEGFAAVLEQLPDYPPALSDAAALRHEARRCEALRADVAPEA